MSIRNEIEFYEQTKKIYKKHKGQLIFHGCYHFSWDAREAHAESFVIESGKNCYKCRHCEEIISLKSKKKIEQLVKYLNDGGRDCKVMTKLYKDVMLLEWAVIRPGRVITNNATGVHFTEEQFESSFGFEKIPIYEGN